MFPAVNTSAAKSRQVASSQQWDRRAAGGFALNNDRRPQGATYKGAIAPKVVEAIPIAAANFRKEVGATIAEALTQERNTQHEGDAPPHLRVSRMEQVSEDPAITLT